MAGFAKAFATGKITNDPNWNGEKSILKFSMIYSRYVGKGKGYKQSGYENQFVDVVFFGKFAESISEYIRKDHIVSVSGDLNISKWEGKTYVSIIGERIDVMDGYADRTATKTGRDPAPEPDLPF